MSTSRRRLATELSEQFALMTEKLAQAEARELELLKKNQKLSQMLKKVSAECSGLSEKCHETNILKERVYHDIQEFQNVKDRNESLEKEVRNLTIENKQLKIQFHNVKKGFGDLMEGATTAREKVEELSKRCVTLQETISEKDVALLCEKEKRHLLERKLDDHLLEYKSHEESQIEKAMRNRELEDMQQSHVELTNNLQKQLTLQEQDHRQRLQQDESMIQELSFRNRSLEMRLQDVEDRREAELSRISEVNESQYMTYSHANETNPEIRNSIDQGSENNHWRIEMEIKDVETELQSLQDELLHSESLPFTPLLLHDINASYAEQQHYNTTPSFQRHEHKKKLDDQQLEKKMKRAHYLMSHLLQLRSKLNS